MTLPLRTPRLAICPLTSADRDSFVSYRDNPAIAKHQGWELPYTASDADALLAKQPNCFPPPKGEWMQLGIHPVDSSSLPSTSPSPSSSGTSCLTASSLLGDVAVHTHPTQPDTYEIGVTIAPAAQRSGVGAEALGALLDALFSLGAHKITAMSDVHNPAVGGLLRKAGFTLEGTAREADWFKGKWMTLCYWGVLASDRAGSGGQ